MHHMDSPITATLEAELAEAARAPSVVVWLDRGEEYRQYAEGLAERHARGEFEAPVVAFQGSYLEMMLALEGCANGLEPEPLVLYMAGHDEEAIRRSPMLEMYRAGRRYERPLAELVRESAQGRVEPGELEAFLGGEAATSLEAAEAWLRRALTSEQSELAARLTRLGPERLVDLLFEEERDEGELTQAVQGPEDVGVLVNVLYRQLGLSAGFLTFFAGKAQGLTLAEARETCAAWLMCVEYVHDLRRSPSLGGLKALEQLRGAHLEVSLALVARLREEHPEAYASYADVVEGHLEAELAQVRPEELGSIDTFRGEERRVLEASLEALSEERWERALEWAEARRARPSFWVRRELERKFEWALVGSIARLGQLIAKHQRPLGGVASLEEAVERYARDVSGDGPAYEVDQAHRHLEQQRLKLLRPHLRHFAALLSAANTVRALYRGWADRLAGDFTTVCERQGFLPARSLQQRTFSEQVLEPLVKREGARVALFLLDGFRLEMAAEVADQIDAQRATIHLGARLAELPTITAVGMNALAPIHEGGRLELAGSSGFKGFRSSGGYVVRRPKDRIRAFSERLVDPSAPSARKVGQYTLAEVCNRTLESLRMGHGGANLLIVHGREVDEAGEHGMGLASFDTWLGQIVAAWRQLKNLGFDTFVFTADHGFMLRDETTVARRFGAASDPPSRRYALSPRAERHADLATVPLDELNYAGRGDEALLFHRETGVFITQRGDQGYVHGGNSPQERIIPVLTVEHGVGPTAERLSYTVEAEAMSETPTASRLRFKLKPAQASQTVLSFTQTEPVRLALRVPRRDDVQVSVIAVLGGELRNQVAVAPVTRWVEVSFTLQGPRDERVKVELMAAPGEPAEVAAWTSASFFTVVDQTPREERPGALGEAEAPAPATTSQGDWAEALGDPKLATVFRHLEAHRSITESELTTMLGSPRAVRRFSYTFEDYLDKIPFNVTVEVTPTGKRYNKGN